MIRVVIDCDGCRRSDAAEAQLLYVRLEGATDGEPGPPETSLHRVDLCPSCLAAALSCLVRRMPREERCAWFRQYHREDPGAVNPPAPGSRQPPGGPIPA